MKRVCQHHGVSERRVSQVLSQHRSVQRYVSHPRKDEEALTQAIVELASQYGRYGYRRITALLKAQGWQVNFKRVERIWRQEGLKVPHKQPKKRRLWLNDESCIRLRPAYRNHVWAYDFVQDRTWDEKAFKMLTIVDEFSRECLAIEVDRKLNSQNVLETLSELFVRRGPPAHIRSDNGSEFCAHLIRGWLKRLQVKTLFITTFAPQLNNTGIPFLYGISSVSDGNKTSGPSTWPSPLPTCPCSVQP